MEGRECFMTAGKTAGGEKMDFPWYVITGDITLDNFNKLWTHERGFIWRGFTCDYEMIPSAANYDRYGKKITNCRTENCHPLVEIQRVAEKIVELNKIQKFPFEIPLLIRKVLFSAFYQSEEKLFKEMCVTEFPDSSLVQAMSLLQHEFGGTSLLDFSLNKYKALYFAIGNDKILDKDSHIFGLNVPYFETHKDNFQKHFSEKVFDSYGKKFDLLYPSYFMNDKIVRQEGVFLYQKFKVNNQRETEEKYENIIEYFRSERNNKLYEEVSLDSFLEITEKEGDKPIFYVLLTVPAKVKGPLKTFLNNIGITDNYMMNAITTKESKIENLFKNGDEI
jgi:hypothetical protein